MNPQAAQQQYLRTRVMTATPEQLQMMLYDGALRFAEQAKAALEARDFERSYNTISRVQKIITELSCTLKRDRFPELCDKLTALYSYVFKKLVEANVDHSVEALDEAIGLLRYQRETWAMLLDQLGKQKAAAAATKINMPAPDQRMEASISMRG
jgi:flagellar secretion chaperone FliS